MLNWLSRFKLRVGLQRAATTSTPALSPAIAHVERQIIGTGRDWKASPAVKPMPDDAESAATNARINREALWERLETWADVLQGIRPLRFQIQTGNLVIGGHLTPGDVETLEQSGLLKWAKAYFSVELEQGYAKRQNVTGRGKLMPRLTPEEIVDAREASRLASKVQDRERCFVLVQDLSGFRPSSPENPEPWEPSADQEAELEALILEHLGGEEKILAECKGNPVLVAQVKKRARDLFAKRTA